jgi:cation diffusion facilitator family transporter
MNSTSPMPSLEVTSNSQRYREMRRVTVVGSVIDGVLGIAKIVVGYLANSQALIADGVHSLSDLITDGMVLLAARHGARDADEDHPYGHRRFETLATVILGISLVLVALGIGWDAIDRLFTPEELRVPGAIALVIAAISVLSKEWIYHYTMAIARKYNSSLLKANAWHSRSDAISSIIVIIGVGGAIMGLTYLDAIAAVGVALMVAKIGIDLARHGVHELTDHALEADRVAEIREVIMGVGGVRELHLLRSRMMGGSALIDVHVLVEPHLSVSEGHYISERVRKAVVKQIDEVTDVLVHIDPEDDEKYPPSIKLPPRTEIVQRMQQQWQQAGVTVAAAIKEIRLHYLEGKIQVEIFLPLDLLDRDKGIEEQIKTLAECVTKVEDIAAATILLQSMSQNGAD